MEQPNPMKDVALYDNDGGVEIDNEIDDVQKPSDLVKVSDVDEDLPPTCLQAASMRVARSPCMYFWFFFVVSFGLSIIGLVVGDFALSVEGEGWTTRGTLIADRQTQYHLVEFFGPALQSDTSGEVWMELINNVQLGFELLEDDDERRLEEQEFQEGSSPSNKRLTWDEWMDWETVGHRFKNSFEFEPMQALKKKYQKETTKRADSSSTHRQLPVVLSTEQKRRLQSSGGAMEGCDIGLYESDEFLEESRLWPVFRTRDSSKSFLDADMIQGLCEIETQTQRLLEENDLCIKCSSDGNSQCLPPYSPVFFARVTLTDGSGQDGFALDCEELAQAWAAVKESTQAELAECIQDLTAEYNPERDGAMLPESCASGFFPSMVDEPYGSTGQALYTSSIFATREDDLDALYVLADQFTQSSPQIRGAYDTQWEDFINLSLDDQLLIDMALAVGSAFVTVTAMMIHTRSPFLSLVGLLQIVLSFPLAFFFYTFVAGLEFFPFLNFIGVFVIFALGADDVFVAVDKWKNARLDHPNHSTAEIAAIALPDAASAMFLTTLTTAVAFFGTAVCPVAPIRCFAVFVGFLVILDYVMCVLLVFPALCIYDYKREDVNCCCRCGGCKRCCERNDDKDEEDEAEPKESLIRRLLKKYYNFVHRVRWGLFVICGVGLVLSAVRAASISLPNTSDVRLYDASDNQYEQNFVWRKNILYNALRAQGGSRVSVIWGVTPGDTGDQNNPETWSQLILDDSFEPSKEEAQIYFRDFCGRFFSEDFADVKETGFVCAINRFDSWLQEQSATDEPEDIYVNNCGGATGLPLPEDEFDACISSWAEVYDADDYSILSREGKVEVIYIPFNGRVRFDSAFDDLENEWNLIEDWFKNENANVAPSSANQGYFTSEDYWWYDTNGVMLQTAFASSGIAMAAAAAVILFSSRSFVLTIFATVTVGYVLTSVTATLVALGWTLGFLEAILFAILIGISVDFVIHFSHAYTHLPGRAPREDRTLHALITMGPSILAAAFTTFAAALVMLFTIITFFEKFAVVLFLTVVQALVGSFVVFITLVDCVGPADPSYIVDHAMAKVYGALGLEYEIQGDKKYNPNAETD